jgi:hypothetical protein
MAQDGSELRIRIWPLVFMGLFRGGRGKWFTGAGAKLRIRFRTTTRCLYQAQIRIGDPDPDRAGRFWCSPRMEPAGYTTIPQGAESTAYTGTSP